MFVKNLLNVGFKIKTKKTLKKQDNFSIQSPNGNRDVRRSRPTSIPPPCLRERERCDSCAFGRQFLNPPAGLGKHCSISSSASARTGGGARCEADAPSHLCGQLGLRKARRDTAALPPRHDGNRRARGCHGDRRAAPRASRRGRHCPHPHRMLRRGSKASERRRHLSDRLSCQQDQALSSSIYLLREIGPTGFLLREEEPENKDFRVTIAWAPAGQAAPRVPLTPKAHTHCLATLANPAAPRCRTLPARVPVSPGVHSADGNSVCHKSFTPAV